VSEAKLRKRAIRALEIELRRAQQRAANEPAASAAVVAAAREILETIPPSEPEPTAEEHLEAVQKLVNDAANLDPDLVLTLAFFAIQRDDIRPRFVRLLEAAEKDIAEQRA